MRPLILSGGVVFAVVVPLALVASTLHGRGEQNCSETKHWKGPWRVACTTVPMGGTVAVKCHGHDVLVSGGCACGGTDDRIVESHPTGTRSWRCTCGNDSYPVHAWALCIPAQTAVEMK